MLKGRWLWRDPERKIILQHMLELEKKPLKIIVDDLDRTKRRLIITERYYLNEIVNSEMNASRVLELEQLIEQINRDKIQLYDMYEESKRYYNNILGEKKNLEEDIRDFKQRAYKLLQESKKYVVETSPLRNDLGIEGDMNSGKVYYTSSQLGVEKILGNLGLGNIHPTGSNQPYDVSGINKKYKEIIDNQNNPLKGRGFVYDYPGFGDRKAQRVVVRDNSKDNEGVIKKKYLFGSRPREDIIENNILDKDDIYDI